MTKLICKGCQREIAIEREDIYCKECYDNAVETGSETEYSLDCAEHVIKRLDEEITRIELENEKLQSEIAVYCSTVKEMERQIGFLQSGKTDPTQ